jgi:hypothetical protein
MTDIVTPGPHPHPWVNLLQDYVTEAVHALRHRNLQVERSWLDPCDPRDATIVYTPATGGSVAETRALVWDEEAGWRTGRFVSGRPGHRTCLTDAAHLGGGVLVDPTELAWRLVAGTVSAPRTYRSYTETRDGLDDALRAIARRD